MKTSKNIQNIENINKSSRKKRKRLTTRALLIVLIPIFAVAVAIFIMLLTIKDVSDYTFNEPAYQYYLNNTYTISSGSQLKNNENSEIIIEYDGVENSVSNLPIYLSNSNTIVLQKPMVYVNPREIIFESIPAFTEVSVNNGIIIAKYGDTSMQLNPGFIYDGKNLYIYLEEMNVTFNGYTTTLSALSYTEAVYKDMIMNFNYENKTCFYEQSKGSAIAKEINNDYSISLLSDDVVNYKDQHYLIYTNPYDLDSIFD